MILAAYHCLDCDQEPIQGRVFSFALVNHGLGGCADCGQSATKLLVGGPASRTPASASPAGSALHLLVEPERLGAEGA